MKGIRSKLVWSLLAAGTLSLNAHAGLFEDEEARKAILDLRAKVQQLDDGQKAQSAQTQSLITDQVEPLRRSLLDLNGQIEALRGEIARLRGQNEQLARDLADTQRKVSDESAAVDQRLRPLEPQKVTLDGKEFTVDPDERRLYEGAIAAVRKGDFAEACNSLGSFLRRYPNSGYADSARFWLGNAQYGQRNYKDAIATFKALIVANPEHPRAAEALLSLANCQIELKDNKAARRSLEDLIKAYPGTEAAKAGKERLAALK
ncbi:MAG: tol-pal system protein YbgF [Burkholderiaceae bacterium]|nr:tol-pal system protein YbgF [Roseateles sp.]MBV8471538.1 tol-pal system protein YbgF [Burkholderiaceae bacterium]